MWVDGESCGRMIEGKVLTWGEGGGGWFQRIGNEWLRDLIVRELRLFIRLW